jgi:hypothetical protein
VGVDQRRYLVSHDEDFGILGLFNLDINSYVHERSREEQNEKRDHTAHTDAMNWEKNVGYICTLHQVELAQTTFSTFFFATGDIARFSLRGVNYKSAMREPS